MHGFLQDAAGDVGTHCAIAVGTHRAAAAFSAGHTAPRRGVLTGRIVSRRERFGGELRLREGARDRVPRRGKTGEGHGPPAGTGENAAADARF